MSNLSFRRYTLSFLGMTLVGLAATTYFTDYKYSRVLKPMTNSSYLTDTLNKDNANNGISQEQLDAEIHRMLADARLNKKDFDMVRIPRPENDGPQRIDQYQDE